MPHSGTPRSVERDALATLTALGQDLTEAFHPTAIAELVAHAALKLLAPDRLIVVLRPADDTREIAFAHNHDTIAADHPLVDLALASTCLLYDDATHPGPDDPVAPSWIGAPISGAGGRCIGAAAAWSAPGTRFDQSDVAVLRSILACAAIALENARLVSLLSIGKKEWEQTVDAISEAFCVVDQSGVVHRANRAFGDITGRSLTDLAGRSWSSLLPASWIGPVARVLAMPESGSVDLPAADRMFTVSALPIGILQERAAVLVFSDQTDKRRLQEQLVQSEKMSAIGQLIAGVAHDLNNPLASVVGFADYLVESEKEAPPHLREPLRAIQQEAERAANIVRNLLSFARKQDRRRRSHQIGPILEATLLLLRNQLMACRVESHLVIEPGLPDVTLEANQVQQVFVNLINNAAQAVHATGSPGNVWVRASRWLDGIAVSVEDDGPGIPDAITGKVFEPFFTTKPDGQGTGLGLSICHGIVTEHGGRIVLTRRDKGGAAFRVEIPGGRPAETQAATPAPKDTGTLRVLVVDDEPHILHYMRATLEAWGHSVQLASDGADALARARSGTFDVIVTDIRMPQFGGRELFEALRAERPDLATRVVFSTGDTVHGDTLAFLESLRRPFLHKPFSLADLRRVLGRVVEDREDGGQREEE